jgi:acetylornithine deacetylase/succinyl-diaminopimelate desuccinylase-like protein
MDVSAIQPNLTTELQTHGRSGRPAGPPPPALRENLVEISFEAMQQILANVPEAVSTAVADIQGDQANMAADFLFSVS